jgi:hypothetical protein
MCSVFMKIFRDADIMTASASLILIKWWMGRYAPGVRAFVTAMRSRLKRHIVRPNQITNLIKTRLSLE